MRCVAIDVLSLAPRPHAPAPDRRWRNWSGSVVCRPATFVEPADAADVAHHVTQAVTLAVEPAYVLEARKEPWPLDRVLDGLDDVWLSTAYGHRTAYVAGPRGRP